MPIILGKNVKEYIYPKIPAQQTKYLNILSDKRLTIINKDETFLKMIHIVFLCSLRRRFIPEEKMRKILV